METKIISKSATFRIITKEEKKMILVFLLTMKGYWVRKTYWDPNREAWCLLLISWGLDKIWFIFYWIGLLRPAEKPWNLWQQEWLHHKWSFSHSHLCSPLRLSSLWERQMHQPRVFASSWFHGTYFDYFIPSTWSLKEHFLENSLFLFSHWYDLRNLLVSPSAGEENLDTDVICPSESKTIFKQLK